MYKTVIILVTFSKVTTFDIARPYKHTNFTDLATAIGYKSETHHTITEDGYILTLFNIPGDRCRPVLIMHGVLNSADSFLLRGNGSLGCALAKQGYDVWFGNYRGNRYNRRHVTFDLTDAEFWNFTFHEMGYYDLPANIDYILDKTGQKQLSAIGFSQGTTIFFVLGSTRPEYNDKIKIFISLAPIVYLKHVEPPVSTLIDMETFLSRITRNNPELMTRNTQDSILTACKRLSSYKACKKLMFAFAGADDEELELDFFRIILNRFPESVSRKLAQHLAQLRNTFAQYDYGSVGNMLVYKRPEPPAYNLSNCVMKTALFVGRNDKLSVVKDVEILRGQLPNVVEYKVLDRASFNHVDFVWGKNMRVHLFPFIFDILEKYS